MSAAVFTPAWKAQYESNFASMKIPANKMAEALNVARTIEKNKGRYLEVEKATGVPWYWVACTHWREASGNFNCYLGDGEPLNSVTHNVPKGRGPFKDFLSGCVDILSHLGFNKVTDWSLGSLLFHWEAFNGEGYHDHNLPSPYVFAGSSVYHSGKYDTDGHFVYTLVDSQLGCAVMLAALIQLGIVVLNQTGAIKMVADAINTAVSPAVAAPAAPQVDQNAVKAAQKAATAGVNVSTGTVVTSLLGNLMSAFVTIGAPMFAIMAGSSTSHYVAGALFGLAGLGSLVTNTWSFITHNQAASSNTLQTIAQLSAMAAQVGNALEPQNANAPISQ